MFKFTGYEYTFKYKPGKLNCNADALSRNPADQPNEDEINCKLPKLKIMILQDRKDSGKLTGEKDPKPRTPTQRAAKAGPSGTQSAPSRSRSVIPRGRGRPLGATSKKTAPPLAHSVIAQRTRLRQTTGSLGKPDE